MGFFDAFDNFLDAVENGAVEKRVNQILDKVEGTGSQALNKVEKLADVSENAVKRLDKTADKADNTIGTVQKKIQ